MATYAPEKRQGMDFDILIVGGTAGGTAAALAAAKQGARVCLLVEGHWLGGQLTSQGVCTPDEQSHIETFGGTRQYQAFREAVRSYYRDNFSLSETAANAPYLNVGGCWVSRISFEPRVGHEILSEMAKPLESDGRLTILYGCTVSSVTLTGATGETIRSIDVRLSDDARKTVSAAMVLDATDLGDIIALCGEEDLDWVTGAESKSDTGEPDAPEAPRKHWVQPFTFPFAIEWAPETAAANVIVPPEDYETLKAEQRYHVRHGAITGLFAGKMPWWRYRRVLAQECFSDPRVTTDTAMINTAGNDYYGGNVIGRLVSGEAITAEQAAKQLARARRVSLGYLYWLQTECEREFTDLEAAPCGGADTVTAGGAGYPEFRLRLDLFDTSDGCAPQPYIRESRRIRARFTVLEQDIVVKDFQGNACRGELARARYYPDSVGIGHYALDIHPNGHGEPNHYVATRPFQIPLGALIPRRLTNLLPACKNLGVTHLTNGAYRLHPIEWNIGESAGLLAAWCLSRRCSPATVYEDPAEVAAFQQHLLKHGIALHWYIDVPIDHAAFIAVQWLACFGLCLGSEKDLLFRPEEPIDRETWIAWTRASNITSISDLFDADLTRSGAAQKLFLCSKTI